MLNHYLTVDLKLEPKVIDFRVLVRASLMEIELDKTLAIGSPCPEIELRSLPGVPLMPQSWPWVALNEGRGALCHS